MGLHFILGTPREVGLTFTPIVQVRKLRLRPIHQLTQAYSMWLECLPRLSGSGAHTLNHSTLLRDNCINESCSTFLDIVFTFQQGAFWRWCLSSGDRVHRCPANYSCQIKLQGPPVLRRAHTWDVSGEPEKTLPGSHSRERRNGPEGLAQEAGKASQGIVTRSGLTTARRPPLPPAVGLRTPPAGPAEVEEASREQEKGALSQRHLSAFPR